MQIYAMHGYVVLSTTNFHQREPSRGDYFSRVKEFRDIVRCLCCFSSEEDLPETAGNDGKRRFMIAIAIVHYLKNFFHFARFPPQLEVMFCNYFILIEQSTGHVQNTVFCADGFLKFLIFV